MIVSIELNVNIVSEIAIEPSSHLPKNLVDIAEPLTPPKVDINRPLAPPKDLVDVVGPSAPPLENLC